MTSDQVVVGLLTGLVVLKGLYGAWLTVKLRQSHDREAKLQLRVLELSRQVKTGEAVALGAIMDSLSKPKGFDQKTHSLLKMAVSNANENESRTAAMEACKRIAKQLGVK